MMRAADRSDIVKKLLLSAWGMFTLVLFFLVVLLVNEMLKGGQDPMAALRAHEEAKAQAPPGGVPAPSESLGTREVNLFFAAPDSRRLVAEQHSIAITESTINNCHAVLELLIQGPRGALAPILPPQTKVNALYLLDDGELVVDFSRELQMDHMAFRSAAAEALLAFGVVNTLTQPALQAEGQPPVRRVRFLLEGSRPQETFPAHIDLSQPLGPNSEMLAPAGERTADAR